MITTLIDSWAISQWAQLVRFIAKKMPKDSKRKCEGEEAQKVATYIHEAFYSKAAQERIKTPRIELARLTVRQYRNAVADLIGSSRSNGESTQPLSAKEREAMKKGAWGDPCGLQGVYFKSFGFRPKNRVFERVDPVVRYDFGEMSPDSQKIEPDRFSIRWEGAFLAPETGNYDFIVRTEHAARLWVNDLRAPLIDAWVRSGASGDTEHRASLSGDKSSSRKARILAKIRPPPIWPVSAPRSGFAGCWGTPGVPNTLTLVFELLRIRPHLAASKT